MSSKSHHSLADLAFELLKINNAVPGFHGELLSLQKGKIFLLLPESCLKNNDNVQKVQRNKTRLTHRSLEC